LGYEVCAFVGIFLDHAHQYKMVVEKINAISEIVECHFTTGNFTFLVKMLCRDNQHLMDVLVNTLQNIPGVSKTETFISLEQTVSREIKL
jgi:Lrp/AsnC family transcriptional regulator for asnA, asnC and gidA